MPCQYRRVDDEAFARHLQNLHPLAESSDVVLARRRDAVLSQLPVPRKRSKVELIAVMEAVSARGEVTGVNEAIHEVRDNPRGR